MRFEGSPCSSDFRALRENSAGGSRGGHWELDWGGGEIKITDYDIPKSKPRKDEGECGLD